jgi:hypothetical protein
VPSIFRGRAGNGDKGNKNQMFAMRAFNLFAAMPFVATKRPATTRANNFNSSHDGNVDTAIRNGIKFPNLLSWEAFL